jgi:hypothetical protein
MSWKEKAKEWGGGDFTFLSGDGDTIVFVVVDDPQQIKTTYKKQEQERIGCPVVTDEGFVLFVTGKRVFRKLSKFESRFADTAFIVTRHGVEGDTASIYTVAILDDKEKTKQLLAIAKKDYKPALLKEALEAVKQVVDN